VHIKLEIFTHLNSKIGRWVRAEALFLQEFPRNRLRQEIDNITAQDENAVTAKRCWEGIRVRRVVMRGQSKKRGRRSSQRWNKEMERLCVPMGNGGRCKERVRIPVRFGDKEGGISRWLLFSAHERTEVEGDGK
jgi:hypothetical protein